MGTTTFRLTLLAMTAGCLFADNRILVEGHRGARAVLPENTLPAFQHAIDAGADYLELDVVATKDDVLIVSHDLTLNAKICFDKNKQPASRPIREMTLSEVREFDCGSVANADFPRQQTRPGTKAPTLDEVFALAKQGKFHFNVETKMNPAKPELTPSPDVVAAMVLKSIRKHKLEKRVIVQSFDFRTLHALAKLDPKIPMAALYPSGLADTQKDFVTVAKEAGTTVVSPHLRLVTPEKVAAAYAAGLKVVAWTANTPAEWQKLLDAKVDGIISDDPAGLIAYLKK